MPSSTSCSMTFHRSLRLWGSSPVVGSSKRTVAGPPGGGQVEATAHPAGVRLEGPVAGVGQVELGEEVLGPLGDDRLLRWLRLPTIWMFRGR